MKFGIRTPSLKKRIAARTSVKRMIRHNLGVKAPKSTKWPVAPPRTKAAGYANWLQTSN